MPSLSDWSLSAPLSINSLGVASGPFCAAQYKGRIPSSMALFGSASPALPVYSAKKPATIGVTPHPKAVAVTPAKNKPSFRFLLFTDDC